MLYEDRWIKCTEDAIEVRFYYFPFGTKRIPYSRIRGVRRVTLSPLRGRGRIWGTANPGYWAHLDPKRPHKRTALVLDLGRPVKPFLTPDDSNAVADAILAHSPLDKSLRAHISSSTRGIPWIGGSGARTRSLKRDAEMCRSSCQWATAVVIGATR